MRSRAALLTAILIIGLSDSGAAQVGAAQWRAEDRVLITDFGFVTALARSSDRLFAATSGGLLVNRDVFQRWEAPVTREDGWPDQEVTAIAWDRMDRMLWLSVADGRLLSMDPDGVRWTDEVRLGRRVDRIVPDESAGGGLFLGTPAGWLHFDTFTRSTRPVSPGEVQNSISRNPDLRARQELISSPGFESARAFVGTGPDGRRWPITDVMPSGDPSRFWVATAGDGLSMLDAFSYDWRPVGVGLLGAGATALAADEDAVWIAAAEPLLGRYGVTRVTRELDDWLVIDSRASPLVPDRGVGAMAVVDGRLWVAGERGVSRREPDGSWTGIAAGQFERGDRLLAIAVGAAGSDGRRPVWVGGERSLDRFIDPGGAPARLLSGTAVRGIQPVEAGAWVATGRGLLFVGDDGSAGPAADVPAFPAGAITGDGTRVWAGVDRHVWQREPEGGWRRVDELGALSAPVTSLAIAAGVLWIGTDDELVSWRTDGRGPQRRYTFAAGDLPLGPFGDRGIADILALDGSTVWIATPAGALRLESPY